MNLPGSVKWGGIALIVVIGLVHLIDAPDSLEESTIKGVLFFANFLGTLVAAFGIYRNDNWGWVL